MVTDRQVRRLMSLIQDEQSLMKSADKVGMSEKTARKYRDLGTLPSQCAAEHSWRTRQDAFEDDWPWVKGQLQINAGLEAKTLFEQLQRRFPGKYQDGQLRTLQRRIKIWRATEGPGREVFFPQVYEPGILSQSDFTRMDDLRVTLAGQPFDHLIYHFVLPYSNWETGTICFSESFESLSTGLQNAFWQLGGVTAQHRTDRLSAAVNKPQNPQEFTDRYRALQRHYGFEGRKIQAGCPNENGDVEQRHHRFKRALDQALMLRGSRDFTDRSAYEAFLNPLYAQLNAGRHERLQEELAVINPLPDLPLNAFLKLMVRVSQASTIHVRNNTYSVPSRLIGEQVQVRLYAEHLEIVYAQQKLEQIPRLRGEQKHQIQYRHIIDTLVRKPGALEHYRYKQDLFPTSRFRMVYDLLHQQHSPKQADQQYIKILYMAARDSESRVDQALHVLLDEATQRDARISLETVEALVYATGAPAAATEVRIDPVDLNGYDQLLETICLAAGTAEEVSV